MSDTNKDKKPAEQKEDVRVSLESTFPASDPPSYWASAPQTESSKKPNQESESDDDS